MSGRFNQPLTVWENLSFCHALHSQRHREQRIVRRDDHIQQRAADLVLEDFAPLLVAEARLVVNEGERVSLEGGFPGGGLGVRGRGVVGVDVPDQTECSVRLEGAVERLEDLGGGEPVEGLEWRREG